MPSLASLLALAAPLMVLGALVTKRDTATNLLVLSDSLCPSYRLPTDV